MNRARKSALRLVVVLVTIILTASASADRLIRYDRTTGATTAVAYGSFSGAARMNSGNTMVLWTAAGLEEMNVVTGERTPISSTPYSSSARFGYTDNYLLYGSTLKNLCTGATNTVSIPTGAKWWDEWIGYGSGNNYTSQNLLTGETHTYTTTEGQCIDGINSTSLIIRHLTVYPGGDELLTWKAFDIETGASTGVGSFFSHGTIEGVLTNDDWVVVSELYYMGGPHDGEYRKMLGDWGYLALDTGSRTTAFTSLGPDVAVRFYAGPYMYPAEVCIWDLAADVYGPVYEAAWEDTRTIWEAHANSDYVIWFDNLVPEPSSFAAIAGMLILAGVMRRRMR